jgi:S1-C subfamily serine protease
MARTLIVILTSSFLFLVLISSTSVNSNEKARNLKKKIEDSFVKALVESAEARDYCGKIHSQVSLQMLIDTEECSSLEKIAIFKKYNLLYPEVLSILKREHNELDSLVRKFTTGVVLGEVRSSKKLNESIALVHDRTIDQISGVFTRQIAIVAKNEGSDVVGKEKSRRSASGTAFFVNNNGNIVTNNHVVEGCSGPIKVFYNKKEYTAKVIAKDGTLDLAVLNSDVKPNQYLKLSKKSGDKLDRVVAAGYPLGYKISDELKLTAGIVSATKGWKDNINEFQIDAALNPGNSGGPVVNDAGNLFGVAVAGLADRQNLNFAIKSKAVKDFLDVNKVSYSTATVEFDMDNKKRLKLLEDSTVFIYCN